MKIFLKQGDYRIHAYDEGENVFVELLRYIPGKIKITKKQPTGIDAEYTKLPQISVKTFSIQKDKTNG